MEKLNTTNLNRQFGDRPAEAILETAVRDLFHERIALVSSFGTESAVLLHMVSKLDSALPVLFLNTLKHFDETIEYRNQLTDRLGLSDVRSIQPAPSDVRKNDPAGILWASDPDKCCALRKVRPLETETIRFDALISGRKRHHGDGRSNVLAFDQDGQRIKVNPLANWTRKNIQDYFETHDLLRHPLESDGYPSIGCAVCTSRTRPGESFRAGRWRGAEKTECGIHLPPKPS